jgi:hypothetical protein
MKSFRLLYILLLVCSVLVGAQNSTTTEYEDETTYGGMVSGSWSIGEDSSVAYECSGIAGATDC